MLGLISLDDRQTGEKRFLRHRIFLPAPESKHCLQNN